MRIYRYFIVVGIVLVLLLTIQTDGVAAGSDILDSGQHLVDGGQVYEEPELMENNMGYNFPSASRNEFLSTRLIANSAAAIPAIRIMPLGDSTTKGTGTCSLPDTYLNCIGYREDLWNDLVNNGFPVNFVGSQGAAFQSQYTYDNDHEGHGGWHASDIRDNIYSSGLNWLQNYPAEIILLHIGTNDIGGITPPGIPGIVQNVEQILDKIDQYESDKGVEVYVILARIINRNDPDGDEEAYTTMFNQQLQTMADGRGGDNLIVVDMEAALNYPGDYSDDLHPNAGGYSKMADVWYAALEELINLPPSITTPGDQYTLQNESVSFLIQVTDPENDTLTYSASGLPPGLTINTSTGEILGKISSSVVTGTEFPVTITVDDQTPFPDSDPYNQDQVSFTWKVMKRVLLPVAFR